MSTPGTVEIERQSTEHQPELLDGQEPSGPGERLPDRLRDRWSRLGTAARGVLIALGAVVALFLAYNLPGSSGFLKDNAPTGIVVAGVITGTVTALMAMGLVLIYRTNRFINFAYGAMGSLAGVTAIGLHLQQGVNFFLALPIGVAMGVMVGALVDLVIRRFQNSSRLIVTVASIGLAQILAFIELRIANDVLGFIALTGGFTIPLDWSIALDGKTLFGDEILMMLAVPPVLAFLAWFLLRTDAGIGVRAAAENADRALLLGIPIRRLSTVVWMIAGGLAALTFVLKAPSQGVSPGLLSGSVTVMLPALAAAVVARMESLPVAFGAGVALGVVEQVVRWNTTGTPTFQNVVFLGIILAALLLQRGALSRAMIGATSTWSSVGVLKPIPEELRGLPEVRWAKRALIGVVALAFVLAPATWSPSNQFLAGIAMIWAMAAVALVILTGWGGHISLGQFAIVGIGALVAGNLLLNYNLDLFIVLILSGVAGAVISLLVGLPALRIQGLFLAVTTLALAVALDTYVINENNFATIIPQGVERPLVWERFDMNDGYVAYLVCLAFFALSVLVAQGMRRARGGRVIIATRDNQRAADAASVPTTNIKLAAFLVAGIICGVAGGLHMVLRSSLFAGSYQPVDSLALFATAVIGGLGSIAGAVTGVLTFYFLGTVTALGEIRQALTGAVLLIVLLVLPGGIGQLLWNLRDRVLIRIADRRDILVPSLVADRMDTAGAGKSDESGLLSAALAGAGAGPRPNGEEREDPAEPSVDPRRPAGARP
jgi:branched-chain amino acid transport system permease protein